MKPRNHEIFAYREGRFEDIRPEVKEFLDAQAKEVSAPKIEDEPILLIEEHDDKVE